MTHSRMASSVFKTSSYSRLDYQSLFGKRATQVGAFLVSLNFSGPEAKYQNQDLTNKCAGPTTIVKRVGKAATF